MEVSHLVVERQQAHPMSPWKELPLQLVEPVPYEGNARVEQLDGLDVVAVVVGKAGRDAAAALRAGHEAGGHT